MRNKIEVTELIYCENLWFLVRTEDKVYFGTKYTHDKMTAFEKWYRQTLKADISIEAGAKPKPAKLWAGVSVSSPNTTSNALFTVAQAKHLMIGLALVNDGTDPVPFNPVETELVVNGKPLAGFGDAFREGPVWDSIVPGKPFSAALGLGKHFAEPGVYKVQWRIKEVASAGLVRGGRVLRLTDAGGVESAVLEFRVVAE